MRWVVAALFVLLAAGCYPRVTRYIHIDAQGASYKHEACGDIGAPVTAILRHDEIIVYITLDSGDFSQSPPTLRMVAPKNRRLSLDSDQSVLEFEEGGARVSMRLAPRVGRIGEDGVLHSGSAYRETVFYEFVFAGVPEIKRSAVLTLPVIRLDGQAISLPLMRVSRKSHSGLVPLNC